MQPFICHGNLCFLLFSSFYSLPSYYLFAIMSRYLTVKITYLTYKKIPDNLTLT